MAVCAIPEESLSALSIDELALITGCGHFAMLILCYIPLDVYKRVRDTVPMAAEVFPEDAFEAAMQSLIRDCALEFKKHFGNQHKLAFICDDGPSAHLILDTYQGFKRVHSQFNELIGSYTLAA